MTKYPHELIIDNFSRNGPAWVGIVALVGSVFFAYCGHRDNSWATSLVLLAYGAACIYLNQYVVRDGEQFTK